MPLDENLVQGIAYWRSLYDAIDRLWLDSGEYEEWAEAQLSNIKSPVNVRGLEVQRELNARHKCYYWYFQDESADDFQTLTRCLVCSNPFKTYNAGIFPQFLCEKCCIITVKG
ncbi:MAG: DUF2310 family Zn-ribbon-containing protein [Chloroflexia bacterium]